ncbi:hypothetical protein [Thermoanaerobacter mathranii]|uniref:hypothetical protein n=1 Tax=Thermoanaerobacter mathranii TaxID=583357 RepID=UPI003D6A6425
MSMVSTKSLTFSVPNLVSNGLKYRYQDVLDKVYILNTYELYVYVQQRGYNLSKSLMSAAKEKYSYYNSTIAYWLASSEVSPYGEYLHLINASGEISVTATPKSSLGVVPVINPPREDPPPSGGGMKAAARLEKKKTRLFFSVQV